MKRVFRSATPRAQGRPAQEYRTTSRYYDGRPCGVARQHQEPTGIGRLLQRSGPPCHSRLSVSFTDNLTTSETPENVSRVQGQEAREKSLGFAICSASTPPAVLQQQPKPLLSWRFDCLRSMQGGGLTGWLTSQPMAAGAYHALSSYGPSFLNWCQGQQSSGARPARRLGDPVIGL